MTQAYVVRPLRRGFLGRGLHALLTFAMALCMALVAISVPVYLWQRAYPQAQNFYGANRFVDLTQLYSPHAILLDADGTVLAACAAREEVYPASLTKLMTAVVVLENLEDLDRTVTMPEEIYPDLYRQNASRAGFQPGESVTVRDLLYGALLPSGAECCLALAGEVAGDEAAFAALMNQKAADLGMNNTNFVNATGLHDPAHVSTAADLAALLHYALQNETFRAIFTTPAYATAPTEQHPQGLALESTMFSAMNSAEIAGGEILGGKTGFTSQAGLCLASLAEVNGKEYILVTTGAPGTHASEPYHIRDAQKVYGQLAK